MKPSELHVNNFGFFYDDSCVTVPVQLTSAMHLLKILFKTATFRVLAENYQPVIKLNQTADHPALSPKSWAHLCVCEGSRPQQHTWNSKGFVLSLSNLLLHNSLHFQHLMKTKG
jgi:hypothetical protein